MSKEVVLHLITWNGNTFDLPMWILCTDQVSNKRGEWASTFGKVRDVGGLEVEGGPMPDLYVCVCFVLCAVRVSNIPIFTDYFGIFGLQVGHSKP